MVEPENKPDPNDACHMKVGRAGFEPAKTEATGFTVQLF